MSQITSLGSSNGGGGVASVTGGTGINITGTATNPVVNLNVPVIIANGGTNATSFSTIDGTVYYDGTRLVTTATGTAGQVLTSNGAGVAPTYQSPASGSITITGDTGGPLTGSSFTFTAGTTGLSFGGAGTTETLTVTNFNIPATTSSATGSFTIGGSRFAHAFGANTDFNTFVGINSGNYTLTSGTALRNTGIGAGSLLALTTGINNTGIGQNSLHACTNGDHNTGLGWQSLVLLTAGIYNTSAGRASGNAITGGSYNSFFGANAGQSYTGVESSNITIGYNTLGTIGESNVLRIGNATGSGNGQIAKAFISGIAGVSVSNLNYVTIDTTTGQLGSLAGGAGVVTIDGDTGSATGSTITFNGGDGSSQFTAAAAAVALSFSDASANTFVGNDAGNWPTSLGDGATFNTGTGYNALLGLTSGVYNSGHGSSALFSLTDGTYNTGCGGISGGYLGTGAIGNTAVGYRTFTNVNGDLVTGAYNIAVGANAGSGYHSTESSNILIGAFGVIADQTTTRIGYINGTASTQTACYIDGIFGATVTGSAVLIDATGLLGTVPSSRRFKDDIVDMTDSEVLHKLRPVNFTYKSDETKHRQWGCIAEEVAEVCPDLVLHDEQGEINTVRYLDMIPMLLNEVQKLRKEVNVLKGI
jgi:hypothetical protein